MKNSTFFSFANGEKLLASFLSVFASPVEGKEHFLSIKVLLAVLLMFLGVTGNAQVNVVSSTGTSTSASYATLAAAITAINGGTIHTGTITCTVNDNHTETAPAGGYSITATGTSTNPIVFKRANTGGSKPLFTAFAPQASGIKTDGVFKIIGGDYITIDGFSIQENASNTTTVVATNNMTEFGIGLFLTSATDGAQNNTIQNCSISLGATYQNAIGIFSSCASSSTNTALAASNTAGTNSNNKIYSNTISNVAYGIYAVSPTNTSTIIESGWDIGGTSSTTGNTISFGNATLSDISLTNFSATSPAGITIRNGETGTNNIRFNTITSAALAYAQSNGLYGVVYTNGTAPSSTVAYTSTISDNKITLTNSAATATTGIDFGFGNATANFVASTNTINLNTNVSAANAKQINGINASYTFLSSIFNTNTITVTQGTSSGAFSSQVAGIANVPGSAVAGSKQTISNNIITVKQNSGTGTYTGNIAYIFSNVAGNFVVGTGLISDNQMLTTGSTLRTTGTVWGIYHDYTYTSLTINNNVFNIDKISASGAVYGTYATSSGSSITENITNNSITATNLAGTTSAYGIYELDGAGNTSTTKTFTINTIDISGTNTGTVEGIMTGYSKGTMNSNAITLNTASATQNALNLTNTGVGAYTVSLNNINMKSSSVGTVAMRGIYAGYDASSAFQIFQNTFANIESSGGGAAVPTISAISLSNGGGNNIYGNIFTSLKTSGASATGLHTIWGINTSAGTNNIYGNVITNISTAATTGNGVVNGLYLNGGTNTVYKNKIYDLSSSATGAGTILSGINSASGANTIYNNTIGFTNATNLAVSSLDAIRGINISGTGSTANNVYYNTIYLNATSSGANFGSTALYAQASATATVAPLNLRNNIIINNSAPKGTGISYALRRTAATLANYILTSNNNILYAGTPSANNLIYYDGTNSDQTLADFQTRVAARETLSQTENTSFISTTGSNADFLRIPSGSTSKAESNAVAITTPAITDDYWGITRPFPSPVNGGTAPDIGASEFDGIPTDTTPPTISYTALTNTCATSATLTATITDTGSGVPTSGVGLPVAYYKINSGSYSAVQGVYVSGNTYTFTIGTGSAAGDTVSYYIVAQDAKAGTPNVIAFPTVGAAGYTVNPPAASTPPTTPSSYTVVSTTGGTTTATPATLCNSGTSVIAATGYGTGAGITYQWQSSTDNFATNTVDIGTASTTYSNYTTPTITSTMYYRLKVTCTATSAFNTSASVSVTVSNPTITGTTPGARCGVGTVTLGATGSAGTTLNWYVAATGGASLGTGSSFTTPSIATTTPYYVEAGLIGAGSVSIGTGLSSTSATAQPSAFVNRWPSYRIQTIYTAAELQAAGLTAGNITGMSYNITTLGDAATNANYTVKIGTTPLSTFTTAWQSTAAYTTVFPSATYTHTSSGLQNIPFSTPYLWDGSSNIIIDITYSGANLTNNSITKYTTATNTVLHSDTFGSAVATGTVSSNRLDIVFNGQVTTCKSSRTPVTATIASAPNLTINNTASTTCNGSLSSVVLTSTASDFDSYVWSATTGTGAIPTGNQTTGWTFSPASTTTYTLTATNTTTSCTNSATYTVTVLPTSAAIAASSSSFCGSGTPSLSLNPSTGYGAATFQWQISTDGTTYSDILGATSASYTAGSAITATTYYKVIIKDSNGNTCLQPTIQITVNNPQVLTTNAGTRCGTGTVPLAATGSAGSTLNWYAASTGGAPLGTGSSFTTPSIAATTNYYVDASYVTGGSVTLGTGALTATTAPYCPFNGTYGGMKSQYLFTASELSALGLRAGNITSLSFDLTSAGSTLKGFTIQMGTTGLTAVSAASGIQVSPTTVLNTIDYVPAVGTKTFNFDAPFVWDGTSNIILSMSWSNNNTSNTGSSIKYYNSGYNSSISYRKDNETAANMLSYTGSTGPFDVGGNRPIVTFGGQVSNCKSTPRTLVTATVTTAPAVTLVNDGAPLCAGSSKLITLSSTAGNYSNYVWSVTSGAGALPTGDQTAGWTFTPASTTTYSLNASNSDPSACVTTATVTISVNPAPTSITLAETPVSPGGTTTCDLDYVKLDATNNLPVTILAEGFETSVSTVFNLSASSIDDYFYIEPFYTEGTKSIGMASDSSIDGAGTMSITLINSLDLTKYSGMPNVNLTFDHICATEAGSDWGYIQYSTNGGTSWTNFPTTAYTGGATLKNSVVSFDKSSYTDWNSQFTSATSTPGTTPATALFKTETINLNNYLGNNNFKIRFRYTYDYSIDYYGWIIDNVKVNATPKVTWSPTTGLYTDAALTTPYVSGSATTLYASPETAQTYTATATLGTCTKTASSASIVTDKKTFTAKVDNNWSVAGNWLRGSVPTIAKCVNIPSGKTAVVDIPNAVAKNVTVAAGGKLTINAKQSLTVKETFTNNAGVSDVMIESDGNLIQNDNTLAVPNSGPITAKRLLTVKDNTQYNYLISPLIGKFLKTGIYENAGTFSDAPLTLYHNEANNRFYTSTGAYILGRGLAVKEPATGSGTTANVWFTGVPMNGDFSYTLANSNPAGGTDLGYNLTGNPYPSNIDLIALYNLPGVLPDITNNNNKINISSTFYFWDNTANAAGTAQGGSGYNGSSYAIFNVESGSSGTGLPAGTLSGTTLATKIPTNVVKVGQAFMVKSAEKTNKKLFFDNTIRVGDGGKGFFGNQTKQATPLADDRYRLKFATPSNITTELAVVYFEAGNDGFAKDDSEMNGSPSDILYTLIGDKKAVINGRSAFVNTDVIPLGSNHFAAGNYTISLGTAEGIFANGQNIYLKDRQTGILTNLSSGNYTFQATAGESTGRFEIVYIPETVLATDTKVKENLTVYRDGNDFVVKAQSKKISSLEVFDTAGRLILQLKPDSIKAVIPAEKIVNGVYVLKIDQNGEISSRKIIR